MIQINRGRINLLLSSAAFTISSAGSVLLHIVLAVTVYAKTGSGLMTSLFVSLQWLPTLLVVLYRSDWDHGMNPRARWLLLEFVSAALTVPIYFFITDTNYLGVALLLLVRGLFDQVNRINKTVAARVLFPKPKATHYASFLQSSYHVGIGLAAVLGIFVANRLDLRLVVILDGASFVIAAALISLTRTVEEVAQAASVPRRSLKVRVAEYRDALNSDRRLLLCAILPPLTATFFQGTYSALQPIFPIQKLGLGPSAVSASYVMASVAVVVGSSSFSLALKKYRLFEQPFTRIQLMAGLLSLLTAGLYVGAVASMNPLVCAALFTLMVIFFEFTWMLGYSGIVAFAPKGQLGSVFGISFALGCFFASVLAALVGALLDRFGNDYTLLIGLFMMMYLSIVGLAVISYKPAVAAYSE
ncbi:MFS transporter [Cystobacter fuscus]|uniref:MFS transporter n=1 Tax=Cystobacter fuscus TaxID=43 RepID=UPI002B29C797|nr:MFS transporter [Cystobacter fuscus]